MYYICDSLHDEILESKAFEKVKENGANPMYM